MNESSSRVVIYDPREEGEGGGEQNVVTRGGERDYLLTRSRRYFESAVGPHRRAVPVSVPRPPTGAGVTGPEKVTTALMTFDFDSRDA